MSGPGCAVLVYKLLRMHIGPEGKTPICDNVLQQSPLNLKAKPFQDRDGRHFVIQAILIIHVHFLGQKVMNGKEHIIVS